MPRREWSCPNCDSELVSSIRYWKPRRSEHIDAYACHDCGQLSTPADKRKLPEGWEPYKRKITKKTGQMDLFGKIENIRDVIYPVPKMVESWEGNMVIVSKLPAGMPQQYADELQKMVNELKPQAPRSDRPFWYKYRKLKRGKK